MDPALVAAVVTAAVGLFFWASRKPDERSRQVVELFDMVQEDLRAEYERTREALERCRARGRQMDENERLLMRRLERLEHELIEHGLEVPSDF